MDRINGQSEGKMHKDVGRKKKREDFFFLLKKNKSAAERRGTRQIFFTRGEGNGGRAREK